jgi:adenosylhomocysteine nucleosidase
VDGLLSFGLAGGLDPALRAGDIVVPASVREGEHVHATDPVLAARFGRPRGVLLAVGDVVADAAEKAALFAATGALAIDLESGAVARVAARHGVAFAGLRAISDPAGSTLPPAALLALDRQGSIVVLRVLAAVARHPGQVPALIALARDAAAARTALRQRIRAG